MTDISVFTASFVLTCSGQRSTKQRAVPGTHVAPPAPRFCWYHSQVGCWGVSAFDVTVYFLEITAPT